MKTTTILVKMHSRLLGLDETLSLRQESVSEDDTLKWAFPNHFF